MTERIIHINGKPETPPEQRRLQYIASKALYTVLTSDTVTGEDGEPISTEQSRAIFRSTAAKRDEYIIVDHTNKVAHFKKQPPGGEILWKE